VGAGLGSHPAPFALEASLTHASFPFPPDISNRTQVAGASGSRRRLVSPKRTGGGSNYALFANPASRLRVLRGAELLVELLVQLLVEP